MSDKWVNYFTQTYTNQTTNWLMHSWSIFGAQTSHEQTWTRKIHHNPNLGEVTTFPFIIFFVPSHGASTQMSFCPRTVATPLWAKCEDETHIPKSGNFESSRTPKNSEFEFKGQNTSHLGVLYTIGKVLKCRCPKWPRMSHLEIYNTSYGRKKGKESNW
jgi:hypothetical protein